MRALILAGLLSLSACATAESSAPAGRDCFRNDDVNGYSVLDDHTVRVNVGANRAYLLGIPQNVRELDWGQQIALQSDNGWICTGNGLGVEVIGGQIGPRRYQVRSIAPAPAPGS
jgi:hypothetical protein